MNTISKTSILVIALMQYLVTGIALAEQVEVLGASYPSRMAEARP